MPKNKIKPPKSRYSHNCDACIYCGQIGKFDIWYCTRKTEPTIILQYGEEGKYIARPMIELFYPYLSTEESMGRRVRREPLIEEAEEEIREGDDAIGVEKDPFEGIEK